MATTKENIREWLRCAKKQGATHMLVVCDTYDWEDYPVNVMPGQDVHAVYEAHNGINMQIVMEVYNLKKDLERQLSQDRCKTFIIYER